MALAPQTGAKRLRELLSDPERIVVAPGVFDGFTARLALAAGFDALYMVIPSSRITFQCLMFGRQEQERQYLD
jgi:2-methylisocitrate lyase-like PEP mutase family enzyme